MNFLTKLLVAGESKLPFKQAMLRLNCMDNNHAGKDYKILDRLESHKHPDTNKNWIVVVNIHECLHCGLVYNNMGSEPRDFEAWLNYKHD